MRNKRNFLHLLAVTCIAAVLVISCQKKEKQETAVPDDQASADQIAQEIVQEQIKPAVICMYDGIPLRETPAAKGKWISSISLGETATWLEETAADSTDKNREYLKLELSDGKTGWSPSYGLVREAKVGAIKQETKIFKRPDFVTATADMLAPMDIIATTTEKDEWIEVCGEKMKKKGWINSANVTWEKEDVAVAIQYTKEVANAKEEERSQKIATFIEKTAFPASFFIQKLKEQQAGTVQTPEIQADPVTPTGSVPETPKENPDSLDLDIE